MNAQGGVAHQVSLYMARPFQEAERGLGADKLLLLVTSPTRQIGAKNEEEYAIVAATAATA